MSPPTPLPLTPFLSAFGKGDWAVRYRPGAESHVNFRLKLVVLGSNLPAIWLHEAFHVILGTTDEVAVTYFALRYMEVYDKVAFDNATWSGGHPVSWHADGWQHPLPPRP